MFLKQSDLAADKSCISDLYLDFLQASDRLSSAVCDAKCGDLWCGSKSGMSVYTSRYFYNIAGDIAFAYLGCYNDVVGYGDEVRDLPHARNGGASNMDDCWYYCREIGYEFAGTQAGRKCFCGYGASRYGPSTSCDTPCVGGGRVKMCGGKQSSSIYLVASATTRE
eukprot:GHVU01196659.1.p2 GENE.GHVU01196659.1~~GHVU01196659.1.p2  ORF type:complete len:166 (-),score=9.25 GHVU01196659.1:94-591(-)